MRDFFAGQGCELLETAYVHNDCKMRYRCVCGNISDITFKDFKTGRRCSRCKYLRAASARRRDPKLVEKYFHEHGCEVLDMSGYVNNHTPLPYRCNCGKVSRICLASFERGRRCKECGRAKNTGSKNHNWVADKTQSRLKRKIRNAYSFMLKTCLRYLGRRKKLRTEEMLGYPPKALQERLQSHPNWCLIQGKRWCVDHVFPIEAFLSHGITDVKIINGLDNLRPLSSGDNVRKSDTYNEQDFLWWLETKGIKGVKCLQHQ